MGRPRLCAGIGVRIDILAQQQHLLKPLLVKIFHLQQKIGLQLLAVKVPVMLSAACSAAISKSNTLPR